ncbi:MAG: ATP-grasp domain-containing protein [Methylotenera sp.]|nr:ATP-grasp domain-containing protein [Methylotenera sp.]
MSARPFVEAAVNAGYSVVAIDAFSDVQTVALAEKTLIVSYDDLGFRADDLLQTLEQLDKGVMALSQFVGCVYGSGFEAQPDLLKKVAEKIPVIGNSSATLAAVKNASVFFARMQKLNIRYPETFETLPADADLSLYIHKFSGGSGGVHIKPAKLLQARLADKHCFFQHKIEGLSVSLLFIANGDDIQVVGFNGQWVCADEQSPFRYGGAVSHVNLSMDVQQQLISAAKQLTSAFGLVGLNSLDAIVEKTSAGDAQVYVLEINPRLSATVDLYSASDEALFDRHMQACLFKQLTCDIENQSQGKLRSESKAHAIVYADIDVELMAGMVWPNWVTDSPTQVNAPLKIFAGAPVCSVHAFADNADAAKKEVLTRVRQIKNLLQSTH